MRRSTRKEVLARASNITSIIFVGLQVLFFRRRSRSIAALAAIVSFCLNALLSSNSHHSLYRLKKKVSSKHLSNRPIRVVLCHLSDFALPLLVLDLLYIFFLIHLHHTG